MASSPRGSTAPLTTRTFPYRVLKYDTGLEGYRARVTHFRPPMR
jgi:hypothetical protein